MRETRRDDYHFHLIHQISDESFRDIERPGEMALRYQYDHCELWTREVSDRIVAYAIVTMDCGEPYIWSIATKTEFRSRGIASGLIKEILTWYYERHAEGIGLTVNVNNPAQKIYFDEGFRVTRVMPRDYGEISGLRMRRRLR